MDKMTPSENIYTKKSTITGAGRGVFAARDIQKGEIIETCPVIEISAHDMANLKESILVTFFFFFGAKKEKAMLALGFGSLYNHSYSPNATYKIKPRDKTMDFVAIKNIPKGTEITFNYLSGNPKNINPLWFEA